MLTLLLNCGTRVPSNSRVSICICWGISWSKKDV